LYENDEYDDEYVEKTHWLVIDEIAVSEI